MADFDSFKMSAPNLGQKPGGLPKESVFSLSKENSSLNLNGDKNGQSVFSGIGNLNLNNGNGASADSEFVRQVFQENARMRNLLVAWQNAYRQVETGYKTLEKENAELGKTCKEQIRQAKMYCLEHLQGLRDQVAEKRNEVLFLRKQLYSQTTEVAKLYKVNKELNEILQGTREQMHILLLRHNAIEKKLGLQEKDNPDSAGRTDHTDPLSHQNFDGRKQVAFLEKERQLLTEQNIRYLEQIQGLSQNSDRIIEELNWYCSKLFFLLSQFEIDFAFQNRVTVCKSFLIIENTDKGTSAVSGKRPKAL